MKTIILSAFGQFGDYLSNSGEMVANELARVTDPGIRFVKMIFECKIPPPGENRGRILMEMATRENALAIISLGMDSGKTGLCVEAVATNWINNEKYCGPDNGKRVDETMFYGERVAMDLQFWRLEEFRKRCAASEIPLMEISSEAGGFCCNHLMWQLWKLRLQPEFRHIHFLFLHLPCSPEALTYENQEEFRRRCKVMLPIAKAVQGVKILANTVA